MTVDTQEEDPPDAEDTYDEPERALLVGIGLQHSTRNVSRDVYSSDESLEELSSLAQSAGLQVRRAPTRSA